MRGPQPNLIDTKSSVFVAENCSGIASFEKVLRALIVNQLMQCHTLGHEYTNQVLENIKMFFKC